MPATIKKMGKAAASPFGALTKSTPEKKSKLPILILIVVGGVVVIWYLRNHSSANTVGKSTTNPAVSINGGSAPDQSQIDNLTAAVLALQGLQPGNSSVPSGGTSTPITTQPVATTPAQAVANAPSPISGFVPTGGSFGGSPTLESPQLPGFQITGGNQQVWQLSDIASLPKTIDQNGQTQYLTQVGAVKGPQALTYSSTKPAGM